MYMRQIQKILTIEIKKKEGIKKKRQVQKFIIIIIIEIKYITIFTKNMYTYNIIV